MKQTILKSTLVALLMTGWLSMTEAATVTLSPDNASVTVGSTVTFTYAMDFTDDPTIGGGTDFWYDPAILQFVGWTFMPGGTDDPNDRNFPTDCSMANTDAGCGFDANEFGPGLAQVNGMAFGNFNGMTGPEVIGEMVFNAIGSGTATVFMAANDDAVAGNPGPFVSNNTFTPQDVDFVSGSVSVTNVPLPAAVWFLLSGLGMLGGVRRLA